jgi:hypothetical protein
MKAACIHIFLFLSLVFAGMTCLAQKANVEVIRDPAIDELVSKHIQVNENRGGISGFRIQIFFDSGNNSKTRGQSVYETFSARHPDVNAYLTFKAPNYKVRVGDFRSRLDAVRFLQEILPDYPGAYVITDKIRLPKVN